MGLVLDVLVHILTHQNVSECFVPNTSVQQRASPKYIWNEIEVSPKLEHVSSAEILMFSVRNVVRLGVPHVLTIHHYVVYLLSSDFRYANTHHNNYNNLQQIHKRSPFLFGML